MKTTDLSSSFDDLTRSLEEATGRSVKVEGNEYLFFGGTAYLGLNRHSAFIRLIIEGIQRYGVNNGTSRTNNVQLGIYKKAEEYTADQYGFEDCILVSSGYLAAQLAVRKISSGYPDADIYYSPHCHPALWLDAAPPTLGEDFSQWATDTVKQINASSSRRSLIISNSLDNIIPTLFDFQPFKEVRPDHEVHFLLDDSHGLGIVHPENSTARPDLLHEKRFKLTVVASMAKGLGIDAGTILGDKDTITQLRASGYFIGASPSAPAFLHAYVEGKDLYASQWKKLRSNVAYLEKELPHREAWKFIPDYPVFHHPGQKYADYLAENKILISSFPYPDPSSEPLDRLVISAAHEKEDLDALLHALRLAPRNKDT